MSIGKYQVSPLGWIVAVVIGLALLTHFVQADGMEAKVGAAAPVFTLSNAVDGKIISLTDFKGQVVVLVFDSTRCPVAAAYHERMKEFYAKYCTGDKPKVAMVAIDSNSNPNEDVAEIAAMVKQKGFAYPWVKDEGSKVADLYGARVTPHVFLVDGAGNIQYNGPIDDNMKVNKVTQHYLEAATDALLAGKDVPAAGMRAFGCGIKRP